MVASFVILSILAANSGVGWVCIGWNCWFLNFLGGFDRIVAYHKIYGCIFLFYIKLLALEPIFYIFASLFISSYYFKALGHWTHILDNQPVHFNA